MLGAKSWRIRFFRDPKFDTALRVFEGQWPRWLFVHFWQDPNRSRRILYVNRNPSNRKLNLNYPDNRFNSHCVLAGVRPRNPLHFFTARDSPGGIVTWRIQPPSIRPISARGSERAIYFLLSSAFSSQATWRKNFSKSSLLPARCNTSSFCSRLR